MAPEPLSLTGGQVNDLVALIQRKLIEARERRARWDAMTDEQRHEATEKAKARMPAYLRDLLWPEDGAA